VTCHVISPFNQASMGPRLLGRGNVARFVRTERFSSPLQWGRVCWDAEMKPIGDRIANGLTLQWGRVCWDAEIVNAVSAGWVWLTPSMGPRLLGRGNVSVFRLPGSVSDLQWGRVCWDAEIFPPRGPGTSGGPPSMGPRLLGRGNRSPAYPG